MARAASSRYRRWPQHGIMAALTATRHISSNRAHYAHQHNVISRARIIFRNARIAATRAYQRRAS